MDDPPGAGWKVFAGRWLSIACVSRDGSCNEDCQIGVCGVKRSWSERITDLQGGRSDEARVRMHNPNGESGNECSFLGWRGSTAT